MFLSHTQKTILTLLADGLFHSGTELAYALAISRSGIWKQFQSLDELGLKYVTVKGKGYRLKQALELLDASLISANLDDNAKALIASFDLFDRIPSTNVHLVKRAAENAPSGCVCLAEQQTAGKGRRGRSWVSPFGKNIYLSILWRFQSGPMAISGLSLAIGVAVIRALKHHFQYDFQLKWPNDIYCNNKKLGGILVEVSGESNGPCVAVIGLGLNLSLSQSEAVSITQEWTDLSRITGEPITVRNQLISTLLNQLFQVLVEFEEVGITAYLNEWREYDCLKDKPGTLYIGNRSYEGVVKGIDDQGLLLLAHSDGTLQAYASGEVSFSNRA